MDRNRRIMAACVVVGVAGLLLACRVADAQPAWVQPAREAGATELLDSNPTPAPTRFGSHVVNDGSTYVTGRFHDPTGVQPDCFGVWKVGPDGSVVWTTPLSNPNYLDCYGVCVTAPLDGSTVFAAGVLKGTSGKDLFVVCLLGGDGSVIWQTIYNNTINGVSGDDVPVVIRVRSTNGPQEVFVGGNSQGATMSGSSVGFDYIVLKFNSTTGASMWGTEGAGYPRPFRYNGPGNGDDILADIKLPPAGEGGGTPPDPVRVLMTGTSYGGTATKNDWATLSISNSDPFNLNDPAWLRRTTLPGNEVATSIDAKYNTTPNPPVIVNAFVTGYSDTGVGATNDYRTTSYDPNLGEVWTATYNGPGNKHDMANKVLYDRFVDTLFVSGDSWGVQSGYDIATIAYDPATGQSLWIPRYPPFGAARFNPANKEDRMLDLIADKNGNSYVVGKSFTVATFDLVAVSYTLDGAVRWLERDYDPQGRGCDYGNLTGRDYVQYNGTANGDDLGASIRLASDEDYNHLGDVVVFGTALTNGPGGTHVQRYIVNKYHQCNR